MYIIIIIFLVIFFLLILLIYKYINYNYFFKVLSFVSVILIIYSLLLYKFSHSSLLCLNNWKSFLMILIILLFLLTITLMIEDNFDIYLLYILVFFGSLIIITSDHLLLIYLGLELQTFSLFVLISKNRLSTRGSEAGLKYFILGAISSGFYLLGLCFLFISGISLSLKFVVITINNPITLLGVSLILLSFTFKLGLSPFHFWVPDIYEGSSWDVLSLLATLPKISVLSIFIQLIINNNLILFASLLSIIIGTLGAINQNKLKRLLAYSSINHIGFVVLGYTIVNIIGYEVAFLYLIIYMLTVMSLFILITRSFSSNNYYIIELGGMQYINKTLSFTWMIIFLSIAGIPPLSGFISKWFVIWNVITNNYIISSAILILFSMIGAAYYLRIVKILYFQKQSSYLMWNKVLMTKKENDNFNLIFLGFSIFFSLFLIININPMLNYINYLSFYFY